MRDPTPTNWRTPTNAENRNETDAENRDSTVNQQKTIQRARNPLHNLFNGGPTRCEKDENEKQEPLIKSKL